MGIDLNNRINGMAGHKFSRIVELYKYNWTELAVAYQLLGCSSLSNA